MIIASVTMMDYVAMAEKYPFQISAEAKGKTADIRISGVIHQWGANAEWFQSEIDKFNADGVETINFHLHTPGGSVIEANEIRNIMDSFEGEIHGFGGALVASAGTSIRISCDTFEMPTNGQYMYHKPMGAIRGNEDEVEASLKLLKSLTDQYRTEHATLTGISEEEIEKRWAKGDVWMNSKEALKEGFITSIGQKKAKITKEQKAMFTACAAPVVPKVTEKSKSKTNTEMDVKATALALGLSEDATEAQVRAELAKLKAKADKADQLEKDAKAKTEADRKAEIKAILDKAGAEKKIIASQRENLEKWADADFDSFKAHVEALQPLAKISEQITGKARTETGATAAAKKFEDLTDEESQALLDEDPEAFQKKYEEYLNQ